MQNSNESSHPLYPQNPQLGPTAATFLVTLPPEYYTTVAGLAADNERLRNRNIREELNEQAYSRTIASNGITFVPGKNGRFLELMDAIIKESFHRVAEPPLCCEESYTIYLDGHEPMQISKTVFNNDKLLIDAFEKAGVRIHFLLPNKSIANLLRQEINRNLSEVPLLFYGGWLTGKDENDINFLAFPKFSTCLPKGQNKLPMLLSQPPQAVSAMAADKFLWVFEAIKTLPLRQETILLYHEASIHTLLEILGYKFPLAFCIFSTDNRIQRFFSDLLSWYKSQPISLDAPSDDFLLDLLCRKDQPLFIKDSGRLKSAEKNSEILDSAILNGIVPWKNMRETQNLPIKAPITLLSSTPSALNCSPEVIILDFKHDDFEWEDWLSYLDLARHNQDYMSAFCGFTSSHIPALCSALAEGREKALRLDKGQLTEKCHQAFGIILGLQIFLNSFYAYVFPDFAPISSSIDELADQILELLTQTSEKADIASLPDLFIEIAKELIQTSELPISHRKHYSPGWNNAVFYDDDAIYFTTSAFNRVCQAMMQSRPAILAALEEANLLCGTKINKTTSQTRKTVYSMYGVKNNLPLYAFPREVFETFGDPLITEEEDTHDEP